MSATIPVTRASLDPTGEPAAAVPPRPSDARRIRRRSVAAWVVYDLANTCFSMGVVTLYFPDFVKTVLGRDDATVGAIDSIAALLVFALAPILGAISDQAARRLPFLAVATLSCVAATFFLAQTSSVLTLALFVAAMVSYQAGLIFYDSLLPEVSTDANRGRIGGIGVGVGYAGSLLAYVIGILVIGGRTNPTGDDFALVFRAIAIAFLVLSVPAFLFVRERRRVVPPLTPRVASQAFGQLARTARDARRYPGLGRFLVGRMFYADAANTLIFMVILYATGALGLTRAEAQPVAIVSILCAIPAGLTWGLVVDRVGPKRTLDVVLCIWMAIFAVVAAIPILHLPANLIYPAGAAVGIALAGLWASDRPLMARLAPPRYYGQFFGLYAMVGRFGAVVGPAVWGVVAGATLLNWGQPAAVLFLLLWVVIAFLILRGVDDTPRSWGPEDLPTLEAEPA